MTPFPRPDYDQVSRYDPGRTPVRLDLSDNTNLWGTHPAALERIRSATVEDLARYPDLYADTLREAVGERFGIDPMCVTTGAGSDDILDSAFRAAWGPGATVRFPAPTFSMIEPFARMNGIEPKPVPWTVALDDPGTLLEGDPALVYVCRPDNPSGALAPIDWLGALFEVCGDEGPLVVIDEAYADFAGTTLIPGAPDQPRLLVVRTASKAYGLAGLRCGYGVGAPEVALEVDKSRGPYKVSTLAVEAAALAVRDREAWMAGIVEECLTNRARLVDEITRRGHRAIDTHTNFVLMAAPSGQARADAALLRQEGIGVRPFSGIPELDEALRVTVAPWGMMEEFLDALERAFGGGA